MRQGRPEGREGRKGCEGGVECIGTRTQFLAYLLGVVDGWMARLHVHVHVRLHDIALDG
jgi:hypothetical protein